MRIAAQRRAAVAQRQTLVAEETLSESCTPQRASLRLRTSCLINNYNYARYVGEAVDSALNQTAPFDEIIVVDDGSTDGSVELLNRRYGNEGRVRIIRKANGGQLSCFNEGFLAARGDVIFFLDADDVYEPHYVETMLGQYERRPQCDFIFCAPRLFGRENREEYRYPEDTDFGYTVARTWFDMPWIGNATSCITARRTLLERFLPLPNTHDWRLRADDCLVFGAGLAGGRKFFLRQCLVRYRVHESNGFFGRGLEGARDYPRQVVLERLRNALAQKLGLSGESVSRLIAAEFQSISQPTWAQFKQYLRIVDRAELSAAARRQVLWQLIAHHRRCGRRYRGWKDRLLILRLALRMVVPWGCN